jgi:hypothetical protein
MPDCPPADARPYRDAGFPSMAARNLDARQVVRDTGAVAPGRHAQVIAGAASPKAMTSFSQTCAATPS